MKRLVLDTSVLIEYIMAKAPYRLKVEELFRAAREGRVELYVNTLTLGEVLYVASRVYKAAGVSNPNAYALDYVEWLKTRVNVVDLTENIALMAGEFKKKLRIALPDCVVLATARELNATPVFRGPEKEMKHVLGELEKLGVLFLSQLEIAS